MKPAVLATATESDLDPAEAVRALSQISRTLLQGYEQLAQRAERVDGELVAANAALEAKVAEFDALLQALPCGVVVRDARGTICQVNAAAGRILGTGNSELLGRATHPGLLGAAADGSSREHRRPDGSTRVLSQRCSPIVGSDGATRGSVEIVDDRTEIEHLTERLHAQHKMAALGTMAGGIAHEIRNPMNAVRGFAELLRREAPGDSRAARWAAGICEGAIEVDQIIASMLSLSTPERLVRERVEPSHLAEEALAQTLRALERPERWTVARRISAPTFLGDRVKLRQALRNLLANAIEAQPAGGRVGLTVERDAGDIVFRVTDAGPGIPQSLLRRLGEPFLTTRAAGTGLGLALVHSIAELHGGRLEVSPCPADLGGADIAFRLPCQTS